VKRFQDVAVLFVEFCNHVFLSASKKVDIPTFS